MEPTTGFQAVCLVFRTSPKPFSWKWIVEDEKAERNEKGRRLSTLTQ
jgi:hypothetical protein